MEEKRVYTVQELSDILQLSKNATYKIVRDLVDKDNPPFKVIKLGASYRIEKKVLINGFQVKQMKNLTMQNKCDII